MPIYGIGDLTDAYNEGRVHTQFFRKTSTNYPLVANQWVWGGVGVGNPAADVLIGSALTFNPRIATNNVGGVWPGISPPNGMTKHIVFSEIHLGFRDDSHLYCDTQWFDVLGYYPLIDGSEAGLQTMDNTQTLPRYSDGVGVRAMLVSHISPNTANGAGTIEFVDADGATRSTTLSSFNNTNNYTIQSSLGGTATEAAWMHFDNTNGVRQINSVIWDTTQPGGYHAIVLVKPLFNVVIGGPRLVRGQGHCVMDKCFTCRNAGMFPQVLDGAAINFAYRVSGGTNNISIFGSHTFAWG